MQVGGPEALGEPLRWLRREETHVVERTLRRGSLHRFQAWTSAHHDKNDFWVRGPELRGRLEDGFKGMRQPEVAGVHDHEAPLQTVL